MHRIAEQGVAAHWKYKGGHEGASAADDQRIVWMRHLIEWVQEMQEPSEFLSTLRVDLYPEEVYTFTPKGRVVVLPRGATPIDFAYAVHTEVGHQCSGAKVNGEMVPLRHALANGDVHPRAIGFRSFTPRARGARFGSGFTCTSARKPPTSAGACSKRKPGRLA